MLTVPMVLVDMADSVAAARLSPKSDTCMQRWHLLGLFRIFQLCAFQDLSPLLGVLPL